jgi:hypothetical protein
LATTDLGNAASNISAVALVDVQCLNNSINFKRVNNYFHYFAKFVFDWKAMRTYTSVILWSLFIVASTFFALQGKPPACSQEVSRPQPTVAMTFSEYNQQRIVSQEEQLRNLQEFKSTQEIYNREVIGQELKGIHADISSLQAEESALVGEERGAFAILGALGTLAVFFQFRKNKDR